MPLKRDPQQRNPWAFILPQSSHEQVSSFILRPQVLPPLCVHSPRWSHPYSSPLIIQNVGNSRFMPCLTVSILLAGTIHLSCPLLSQRLAVHCLLSRAPTQSWICMSTYISFCGSQAEPLGPDLFLVIVKCISKACACLICSTYIVLLSKDLLCIK